MENVLPANTASCDGEEHVRTTETVTADSKLDLSEQTAEANR